MLATLPPPAVAWNSWNLGSGSAAAGPLFSLAGGSRPWPSPALPLIPSIPGLLQSPPFLSLFFGGWGGVGWRPGKAPALCVVWDRGSGPLPFRCRRYAANSMGCSLITYLITEECQQCVCFGKGAGGMRRDHQPLCSSHQKAAGRGGWEGLGCPSRCLPPPPPPSPGRGRFLWPFGGGGRGAGEAVVILTRSWKINRFPRHVAAASALALLFLEMGVTDGSRSGGEGAGPLGV